LAGLETVEIEPAKRDTLQSRHLVSDRIEHPPHLAVPARSQRHGEV